MIALITLANRSKANNINITIDHKVKPIYRYAHALDISHIFSIKNVIQYN
jgi:hypothetical protein